MNAKLFNTLLALLFSVPFAAHVLAPSGTEATAATSTAIDAAPPAPEMLSGIDNNQLVLDGKIVGRWNRAEYLPPNTLVIDTVELLYGCQEALIHADRFEQKGNTP